MSSKKRNRAKNRQLSDALNYPSPEILRRALEIERMRIEHEAALHERFAPRSGVFTAIPQRKDCKCSCHNGGGVMHVTACCIGPVWEDLIFDPVADIKAAMKSFEEAAQARVTHLGSRAAEVDARVKAAMERHMRTTQVRRQGDPYYQFPNEQHKQGLPWEHRVPPTPIHRLRAEVDAQDMGSGYWKVSCSCVPDAVIIRYGLGKVLEWWKGHCTQIQNESTARESGLYVDMYPW